MVTPTDYVVKGKDADKHKGTSPYAVDAGVVSRGSVVELVEKSADNKFAKVKESEGSLTWLSISDLEAVTKVTDNVQYTVAYNNVFLYKDPITFTGIDKGGVKVKVYDKKTKTENSKTVNETLAENTKVSIVDRSGKFVYVVAADNASTRYGWVFEGDLQSQTKIDRKTYIDAYKVWLELRLGELKLLDTKQKMEQAKAFLYEIEKVCVDVNGKTPAYTKIDGMSKTPTLSEGTGRSFAPPELIGIIRQYIQLLESTASTPSDAANAVTTSTESVTGGSLYDDIDWNKRLGVPQYRTQSDNLLSPESTCVPTAYAMLLERLGLNRADIIAAIDANLKKSGKTFEEMAKSYFDTEDSVYDAKENNKKREKMLKENKDAVGKKQAPPHKTEDIPAEMVVPKEPNEGINYQRLRNGTSGGMIGKEGDLSKKFKEKGQSEDLLGFLGFLMGYDERQKIGLGTINAIGATANMAFTSQTVYWSQGARGQMKETLDEGGAVFMGVSHKAKVYGGHVITVQQVVSNGLIVDDPFGGGNSDYRQTNTGTDLYAPNNSNDRTNAYRNVKHFTPKAGLDDQDFWAKPGQNLTADESLGNSKLIPYEMIDNDSNFSTYIILYKRPKS